MERYSFAVIVTVFTLGPPTTMRFRADSCSDISVSKRTTLSRVTGRSDPMNSARSVALSPQRARLLKMPCASGLPRTMWPLKCPCEINGSSIFEAGSERGSSTRSREVVLDAPRRGIMAIAFSSAR